MHGVSLTTQKKRETKQNSTTTNRESKQLHSPSVAFSELWNPHFTATPGEKDNKQPEIASFHSFTYFSFPYFPSFKGRSARGKILCSALALKWPGAGGNVRVKPVTYCCCCISIATFRPGEVRRSGGLEVWRSGRYRSYRKRNFRSPSPQQTSETETSY